MVPSPGPLGIFEVSLLRCCLAVEFGGTEMDHPLSQSYVYKSCTKPRLLDKH